MQVKLEHAITVEGEEVRELTLRRPQVKHLKKVDAVQGEVAKVAVLISELAAIPPSSVDQIDGADFVRLAQVVAPFFDARLPTGGTSSEISQPSSGGAPAS